MDLGSAGRGPKTKNPPCQRLWRDLRKSSKKALKLFSSFLRGASCPKSPRFKREDMNSCHRNCIFYLTEGERMSSERSDVDENAVVDAARRRAVFVSRRQHIVLLVRPIRIG